MASAYERWVGHMELRLHVAHKTSEGLPLSAALKRLISIKDNIAGNKFDDGRWIIFLSDIAYTPEKDFFTLLFLGVDKHSGEKCYADIKTLNIREIEKLETEGGAVSAHLCISGKAKSGTDLFQALLEEVDGLSRTRIVNFLKNIIRANCIFHHKDSNGEDQECESVLDSYTTNDISIGEQMKNARLLAVDFVDNRKKQDIDPDLGFYERARIVQFRPTQTARGTLASDLLQKILNKFTRDEYPEVRIKIEDSNGAQRTARANEDCADVLTSAFQKRTLISNISPEMTEATKNIVKHFADLMSNVLK